MESEDLVKQELEELLKQLGKKQRFESSVLALKSLLQSSYPSASPSLRQSVCSSLFMFQFLIIIFATFFNLTLRFLGIVPFALPRFVQN